LPYYFTKRHIIILFIFGNRVSQYTGISVYCSTKQNYIVLQYKSYIPVFSDTLYWYYISSRLLALYKTLIRIPVSSELLLFFTKPYEDMNHSTAYCPHYGMHNLQVGGQRSTCGWISVFVWSSFSNNIPWQYIALRIVIRL
jgi:hypothetical protein